jgi:hypothetical protein
MKARILIVSVCAFIILPSCTMGPVHQALQRAKDRTVETDGRIAQGASDDLGRYIAGNVGGARLTLDIQPQMTYAR